MSSHTDSPASIPMPPLPAAPTPATAPTPPSPLTASTPATATAPPSPFEHASQCHHDKSLSAMRLFAFVFLLFCFALTFTGFVPLIGLFFTLISLFYIPIAFLACIAARWGAGIIACFALPLVIFFSLFFQFYQAYTSFHHIRENIIHSDVIASNISYLFSTNNKSSDEKQNIIIKKTITNIQLSQADKERSILKEEKPELNKTAKKVLEKLLPSP